MFKNFKYRIRNLISCQILIQSLYNIIERCNEENMCVINGENVNLINWKRNRIALQQLHKNEYKCIVVVRL